MLPDNIHHQSAEPSMLPPVQATAVPQAIPAHAMNVATPSLTLDQAVERTKMLISQYSTNPFALANGFQQLKAQYLLEYYHLDPNTDKNG
jgi:hypothetical protein